MTSAGDELRALSAQLRAVNVNALIGPVISTAGQQMRDRARQAAPSGPHLPKYQRSIQFKKDGPLAVEVFAAAEGQGNLAAVLEFGQGRNAPHPHIIPQLEPEAEASCRFIADAIVKGLQ